MKTTLVLIYGIVYLVLYCNIDVFFLIKNIDVNKQYFLIYAVFFLFHFSSTRFSLSSPE